MGRSDTSPIVLAIEALRGKWPNQHEADFYGDGAEGDCEHVVRTVVEAIAEWLRGDEAEWVRAEADRDQVPPEDALAHRLEALLNLELSSRGQTDD